MSLSLVRCLRSVTTSSVRLCLSVPRQSVIIRALSVKSGATKSVVIKESSLPVTSALKFKARQMKKRPAKPSSGLEEWNVVGYSAAESFDLFGIQDALRDQQLYTRVGINSFPPLSL